MADIERLERVGDLLSDIVRDSAGPLTVADLYSAGSSLTEITSHLATLAGGLSSEVDSLPQRAILRDDEGLIPEARLSATLSVLDELRSYLNQAHTLARAYHSAIGHIGVEVDADATEES